jgi:hypothetical protein
MSRYIYISEEYYRSEGVLVCMTCLFSLFKTCFIYYLFIHIKSYGNLLIFSTYVKLLSTILWHQFVRSLMYSRTLPLYVPSPPFELFVAKRLREWKEKVAYISFCSLFHTFAAYFLFSPNRFLRMLRYLNNMSS